MSSAFWSELAKLDDSLLAVQSQVDWMRAGFEFDDDQLTQNVTEARQHGAALRDLVHVERADAKWSDRQSLERLIHELEIAAQERRNQQRRNKLSDLANELEAGTIKHRLEARAAVLSKLRQEAVKQLKTEAALADQVKDLPGPPRISGCVGPAICRKRRMVSLSRACARISPPSIALLPRWKRATSFRER
jgi:hypothetical protein